MDSVAHLSRPALAAALTFPGNAAAYICTGKLGWLAKRKAIGLPALALLCPDANRSFYNYHT